VNRPPFYVEAMDEAESKSKELHRALVEWMQERDPFVICLINEFKQYGIADRAALAEMLIEVSGYPHEPPYDDRLGDTLNELDKPLGRVIRVLENELNAYRIWRGLALQGCDPAELDRELSELPDRLREIGAAAKAAHRKRAQKSGPLAKIDLPELAEKAARFYVTATGKRFTQYHQNWAKGRRGVLEPAGEQQGALFVFRIVEHLMPGRGQELKSVLRKIKVDPPPR